MNNFISEGDINTTDIRKSWNEDISLTNSRETLDEDSNYFIHQALSTPCIDALASADSVWLHSKSGHKYMDFHGNNLHQLGHKNQYIIDRVKKQMDILPFCPRRFTNEPVVECAKALARLLPSDLNRVLFAPAGTLAIGMALKMARVVTGKYKIISVWDSFHGASLDAISIGGEAQFKAKMGPLLPGVEHVPPVMNFGGFFQTDDDSIYADYLEYVVQKDGEIAAFVVETIRNTDVQIPSKKYWKRVREICDTHGILLILDEVAIAFGRTGKMFAFESFGIEPDIICLGKGMGGGIFPMAAIVTRDSYNLAKDISLGHYTHEKSPLGAAATLAVIDYINEYSILNKVQHDEIFIKEGLELLLKKYEFIADVRGIGLLWGIELVKNRRTNEPAIQLAEYVLYECLRNGLSFKVSKGNVLQLSPPLTITREELSQALTIIDQAFCKAQNSQQFNLS